MGIGDYLERIFGGTAEEYAQRAGKAMLEGERLFVVTANPEILMHAQQNPKVRELLLSKEAEIVPDGISVVKAMRILGLPAQERITGVDLAEKLLKMAGEKGKTMFLLGAKEEWSLPWPNSCETGIPPPRCITATATAKTRMLILKRSPPLPQTSLWWRWARLPRTC